MTNTTKETIQTICKIFNTHPENLKATQLDDLTDILVNLYHDAYMQGEEDTTQEAENGNLGKRY